MLSDRSTTQPLVSILSLHPSFVSSVLRDKFNSERVSGNQLNIFENTHTVTVIKSVSGFPAESPEALEPSSQFDESLHSRGKSHDMSHSELEWMPQPPNYRINIKQNISQLQQKWSETNVLNVQCGS